jgi:hypothetical protein
LAPNVVLSATIGGELWLRCVAANPLADVDRITARLEAAMGS